MSLENGDCFIRIRPKWGLGKLDGGLAFAAIAAHELALFAACGFLLFGADDLAVDLIWIGRTLWRRVAIYSHHRRADALTLAPPASPGRLAIFVPAWDEADVIGPMLNTALARLRHDRFRILVGCYPNDPKTHSVVAGVAAHDPRVRVVTAPRPGPTTKADCLNALYRAAEALGARTVQSFAVGIERVDSPKLAPFWLDQPPRTVTEVAARAHGAAIETN